MTGGPFLHAACGGLSPSARAFDILVLPGDDPIDGLILLLFRERYVAFGPILSYYALLKPLKVGHFKGLASGSQTSFKASRGCGDLFGLHQEAAITHRHGLVGSWRS